MSFEVLKSSMLLQAAVLCGLRGFVDAMAIHKQVCLLYKSAILHTKFAPLNMHNYLLSGFVESMSQVGQPGSLQ
jgi:hypothetical protein